MASASVGAMAAASSGSKTGAMLFIEASNKIVRRTVERFGLEPEKRGVLDSSIADFDGVRYSMIVNEAAPDSLIVSVAIPFFASIPAAAVSAFLGASFPGMQTTPPSAEFNVAIRLDAPAGAPLPDAEAIARRVSRLAVDLVGCLIRPGLEAVAAGEAATTAMRELSVVQYRPSETLWLVGRPDRVTMVWSLEFGDVFDGALARVIVSELAEAGRKVAGAPPASFHEVTSPPREVADTARATPNTVGYVSITLLQSHVSTPARVSRAIDRLVLLRPFLLYHIKAAKAALHTRMRGRVASWLEVLHRAVPPDRTGKAAATLRRGGNAVLAAARLAGGGRA